MGVNDVSNSQSFVVYESFGKQIKKLREQGMPADKILDFIEAIHDYGFYGIEPDEDNIAWGLGFDTYTATISRAKNRYEAAIENGKKGGRPSKIDYELVDRLKEEGLKNKEIAVKAGCSVSTLEKYFGKKKKEEEDEADYTGKTGKTRIFPVFTVEEGTNRKNRKNLNDNRNFSGVSSPNGSETRKEVFPADAVKTLPAASAGISFQTPDGEFKF